MKAFFLWHAATTLYTKLGELRISKCLKKNPSFNLIGERWVKMIRYAGYVLQ